MSRYVLRKLMWTVPVLVVATTCAFLVLRLIPGDPVNLMLSGRPASERVRENLRAKLGLNRPLPAQYAYFVLHALRGDFGESFATGQPVSQVIAQQLPASLQLAGAGFIVGVGGGLALGIAAGLYPNTAIDGAAMFLALVGISMPGYWIAMLLIYFFGLRLGWVPIVGGGLPALILPAVVFGSYAIGNLARLVRSSILDVRGEDYIRTARAKGLMERVVVLRHALRNALFPVVTMTGLLLGLFIGGGVITETVFARQGLDAPVVVGIEEQPVLPVAAVHERHRPEVAAADQGAGVLQHRVEADVERHGVDEPAGLRGADELPRLGRGHRQRLLAHDVLAGRERGPGRGIVEHVRGGDVHDVHLGIRDQAPVVAVRPGNAERRRLAFRGGLAAAGERDDLDEPEPAERFDVRRADEPGADHADADREVAGHLRAPRRRPLRRPRGSSREKLPQVGGGLPQRALAIVEAALEGAVFHLDADGARVPRVRERGEERPPPHLAEPGQLRRVIRQRG